MQLSSDTVSTFLNNYLPYIDRFGLVQPEPDGRTSQNGVRFTSECIVAIDHHYRMSMPLPIQAFLDERVKAIHKCQLLPGLIRRAPDSTEQIGPDDMYGACAVGYLYSPLLAANIYRYGKSQCFVFNTEKPGNFTFSAWLGRQPALRAFIKFCGTGGDINFIDQLSIALGITLSAKGLSQDGKMLAFFMVYCCRNKGYKIIDRACEYWSNKLVEHYGDGGVGAVLGKYFHPAHENHPSAIWLNGVK